MTVEEIFTKISEHMTNALMTHDQFANYYRFLGLPGYADCHTHRFMDETESYIALNKHFINHHNKLIPEAKFDNKSVIPTSWYQYRRQDVDNNTRKSAVRDGLTAWVEWERATVLLYQSMYKELMDMGEVLDAHFVMGLAKDTSKELKKAEQYHLNKVMCDYDLCDMVHGQN